MTNTSNSSVFAAIRSFFASEITANPPLTEIRVLNEDEVRAVAGGPELEIGTGV